MKVVNGVVWNQTECGFGQTSTFIDCIIECARNQSCRFAYGAENRTCVLCEFGTVQRKSTANSVALKMDVRPREMMISEYVFPEGDDRDADRNAPSVSENAPAVL
uniref:CW domain-containing protein n=1 Tax=Caenorhabditis tropicalis TaxID=1561998 RepID=A0A1I7T3Q6_9PELO